MAWLAAIVESSDDAIVGKTLDSVIRSWNDGARRIFGYEADEIIGKTVYTLIPPELYHEEPKIIARLMAGERIEHFETVRLRKDGTRIDISLSVSPIRNVDGEIIGAAKLARDITEAKRLRRAERELVEQLQELTSELEQQVEEAQSLQEEVEQANNELTRSLSEAEKARRDADEARRAAEHANAAKGQFLATMSHELRTPLNAIAGYVDLLELGVHGPLTEAQRQDLARIHRSQETLNRLVEDVLSFARLESGKIEYHYQPVEIEEFLGSLEAFIAPRLARKNLGYGLDIACAAMTVFMDRDKVEQIMLNLLSNAVKFTDEGRIDVRCEIDERFIRIAVSDTGRGIAPALRDVIFEPFTQGDGSLTRAAEGTGLGLSISRQLARGMNGDLTVASTLGEGSTFTVILPLDARAAPPD